MPNSVGPGKRKKLSGIHSKLRKGARSRTLAETSEEAVDRLLSRSRKEDQKHSVNVGLCGAPAEVITEDEEQEDRSDVEWEDEQMYVHSKAKGFEIDFQACSKRKSRTSSSRLTKAEKEYQQNLRQVYILCIFCRGLILDNISNNSLLQSMIYSILPQELTELKKSDSLSFMNTVSEWFSDTFRLGLVQSSVSVSHKTLSMEGRIFQNVIGAFQKREGTIDMLNVIFASLLKVLGLETRTVQVLDYVNTKKKVQLKKRAKDESETPEMIVTDPISANEKFIPWKQYCWCEIWYIAKKCGRWMHIESLYNTVDKPKEVENSMQGAFITHVVAYYGGGAQDVGPRYISNINRVQNLKKHSWWMQLLEPYKQIMSAALDPPTTNKKRRVSNSKMALEETEFDEYIKKEERIVPKTIDGFKKSSTYILERHITKFKGLIPNAKIIGEHNGESYFFKSEVEELHSVAKWPHQGRVVKQEEIHHPHKIVKKRVQSKHQNDEMFPENEKPEETTELYGYWQTEPWKRPKAENGIVPRNSYGNVELPPLVKALPENTTYLTLPNLGQICRKLGVDFAPALVGFDMVKGGRQVPKTYGIVICCENVDKVTEAYWERERARQQAIEQEKKDFAKSGWKLLLSAVHSSMKIHLQYGKTKKS